MRKDTKAVRSKTSSGTARPIPTQLYVRKMLGLMRLIEGVTTSSEIAFALGELRQPDGDVDPLSKHGAASHSRADLPSTVLDSFLVLDWIGKNKALITTCI